MRWGGSASKWRFFVVPTRILTTIVSHLVQGEARVDGPVNYVGGLRERKGDRQILLSFLLESFPLRK